MTWIADLANRYSHDEQIAAQVWNDVHGLAPLHVAAQKGVVVMLYVTYI